MLAKRQPKRFWFLLAATLCGGIVLIAIRGKLGLFIHPRYHLFTSVLSLIGFSLLLRAAFQYTYKSPTTIEFSSYMELVAIFTRWLLKNGTWFVLIFTVLILITPSIPQLSTAANKKQRPNNSFDEQAVRSATWFYYPESLSEFAQVLQTDSGEQQLVNTSVTLSGFINKTSTAATDVFELSRFVMMCCAVDANPYSIQVYTTDWQNQYQIDQWVKVTGTFERISLGGRQMLLLNPKSITPISQPERPYDFYRP